MTAVSWVIGSGGLLGSGITRSLRAAGAPIFDGPRTNWGSQSTTAQLSQGLTEFVGAAAGNQWQIFWCAGVGVTGSSADEFREEVATFDSFLTSVRALPAEVLQRGVLFVASSAGGVYGGSRGAPFHEFSQARPLGHYGTAKLAIEEAARVSSESIGLRCLVGRISNLYGPGQSLAKPQGLISHLCLASLTRRPLSVFVPLDTLRDYHFVDDCADLIIASCEHLRQTTVATFHVKVMASGRSINIGGLISQFRQVVGKRPEIIMGSSPQSSLQSTDLRLQSRYWPDLDHRPITTLADGIARTLQDVRSSFLSPPGGRQVGDRK
ncbi:NAD-dependent epimerase/dehydratase family protein [Homoserinimonas sp. A447]